LLRHRVPALRIEPADIGLELGAVRRVAAEPDGGAAPQFAGHRRRVVEAETFGHEILGSGRLQPAADARALTRPPRRRAPLTGAPWQGMTRLLRRVFPIHQLVDPDLPMHRD